MITQDEKDGATILIPAGFEEAYLSEDEKDWTAFLDEMHDGIDYAKITVYRVPTNERGMPVKRQMAFLFDCGLNDYTFSQLCGYIRDEYRSGVYRIQVRDKEGVLRKNKQIAIEAPKTETGKSSEGGAGEVIDRMSIAMQEQSDRFERMMQVNRGPQNDPIAQMTQMMTAMGGMMAALGVGKNNQPPPQTALEKMMEMKMMKDIVGEMMGGGDNDGGKVDNFYGMIAAAAQSFGGPLMQAIAAAQQNGELDQNGIISPPVIEAPKASTTEMSPKENPAMHVQEMKAQLEFLLNQAKGDVPTDQAVKFVIDLLPDSDDAVNSIEQFLQTDDCIDKCILVLPEIREHREWFDAWRKGMLASLNEMFNDPDESANGSAETDAGEAEESDTDAISDSPDDTVATNGNSSGDSGD